MLMGFQSPTAGTATVPGADVRDAEALREARADVGYLPAHPSFDGDVTGGAFLDFQAELKGDARRAELLEFVRPAARPGRFGSTRPGTRRCSPSSRRSCTTRTWS